MVKRSAWGRDRGRTPVGAVAIADYLWNEAYPKGATPDVALALFAGQVEEAPPAEAALEGWIANTDAALRSESRAGWLPFHVGSRP